MSKGKLKDPAPDWEAWTFDPSLLHWEIDPAALQWNFDSVVMSWEPLQIDWKPELMQWDSAALTAWQKLE